MTQGELHAAIIMDGNGRWAERQGLPRAAGHREGVEAVRRVVEAAPGMGIGTLTLYAFSSDNWQRPEREVQWLMRLFREYLRAQAARCRATGVRVSVIGRRDRLADGVLAAIAETERATAQGTRLHLRIAVDYSARDSILRAAMCVGPDAVPTRESFGRLIAIADHGRTLTPDVDLLIRTGGEQRLSDFLLWECAYAELLFVPCMWPDFGAPDLAAALHAFRGRARRFGALPAAGGLASPGGNGVVTPAASGVVTRAAGAVASHVSSADASQVSSADASQVSSAVASRAARPAEPPSAGERECRI